jgi:glycosyltransferase involved in cell wall biosynthesis
MHIALWSPAWPLERFQNGIVTYVHWMKRELELAGHRVSVFTAALESHDPHVHLVRPTRRLRDRIAGRLLRGWRPIGSEVFDFARDIAAAILRAHRRCPIDIIEMEESFGWFADVGKLTSLPVVAKLHGPAFLSLVEDELHTPFGREKIEREGRALRLAAAIVSPCKSTLQRTIEQYGLTPKIKEHIVNPITMDGTIPLWRLEGCDRNTILFVGRFDLRKGADVLLQAFQSMLKDRQDLRLVFIGPDRGLPGPNGMLIHSRDYRDLNFQGESRDHVVFLGPMGNREIAQWRTKAMLTVVASRWENPGYTLSEAMLQGCPVVSTDAGGCPESVIDGLTGRLAKSEDPTDFAFQMCAMLDDPEGSEAMGKEARLHVKDQHSSVRVATLSLELFEKVIASYTP